MSRVLHGAAESLLDGGAAEAGRDAPVAQATISSLARESLPLLIVAAGAAGVLFWRLGATTLADWDEAIYAQISREIVERGEWLIPTLEGQPYVRKPPLYLWATAVLYWFFGVTEFSARAASALSGVGVAVLSFAIGRRLYGAVAAATGVAVLLTSFQFVASSRFGTTDVMLTLCILGTVYGYLRLRDGSPRWWLWIWGFTGAAVMVKSVVGSIGLAVVLCTLLLERRKLDLRSRHFWLGAALAGLIVLPWHVQLALRLPELFAEQYLGHSLLERATGPIDGHAGGPDYYLTRLARYFFPWVIALPFALASELHRNLAERRASRVLLVLIAVVFVSFTIAQTKLRWYILPMYPAMALLIGRWLVDACDNRAGGALAGLLVAASVLALYAPTPVLAVAAVAAGAVGLIAWLTRSRRARSALAVVAALCFLAVAAAALRPLYARWFAPPARVAMLAAREPRSERPLIVYRGEGLDRPVAAFYSGRAVVPVSTPERLAEELDSAEPREIILPRSVVEILAPDYELEVFENVREFAYASIRRISP